MFKLESLVRPESLQMARGAERRGMFIREMCLRPTWNQRCWSCGLHHGWACMCEEKRLAYNEHVERVTAPNYKECTTRLYPNAPLGVVKMLHLGVTETSPPVTEEPIPVTKTCNGCGKPMTGYGKVCNACRQAAYREKHGN